MNQTGVPKSPWRLAVPISSAVVAASNFRLGAFTSGWSSPFHPGPFFVSSSSGGLLGLQANFSCMTISKSHKTTAKGNTLRQFSRQNKVQLSCRCLMYLGRYTLKEFGAQKCKKVLMPDIVHSKLDSIFVTSSSSYLSINPLKSSLNYIRARGVQMKLC